MNNRLLKLVSFLGFGAAIVWGFLAIIIVFSGIFAADMIVLNLTFSTPFIIVSLILFFRIITIKSLYLLLPFDAIMRRLLYIETLSFSVMIFLGILLITGGMFRIIREGMPVFG